jgi:uncharacterized RmlC-like cupin family protein
MKQWSLAVALTITVLFGAQPVHAQNTFTPDQVKFAPAPAFMPRGAQLAVLEGDPMASSGDFTIRIKMPNGYRLAPHTHPNRENVTVLSGTLKVGMGDQFDASKMMSFEAGSFAYVDPRMPHYVLVSGDGYSGTRLVACEIQLHQSGRRSQREKVEILPVPIFRSLTP